MNEEGSDEHGFMELNSNPHIWCQWDLIANLTKKVALDDTTFKVACRTYWVVDITRSVHK